MSTSRVALVTGGASGIGLGVVEGLIERQGWHIYILDLNAKAFENLSSEIKAATNFRKVNVTDYDRLGSVFQEIYASEGRIDFVFANAGTGGALDFYQTSDDIAPPPKPDTSAVDVNLTGVAYTTYLANHYFKLQKLEDASVVITSSDAGLYPTILAPMYSASKHGTIGFLRSIAPKLISHKIRVNAICPGAVITPILPPEIRQLYPKEIMTPLPVVVGVVLAFVDGKEMTDATGTKVPGDKLTGQVVEISVDKFYFHSEPEHCDENSKQVSERLDRFAMSL